MKFTALLLTTLATVALASNQPHADKKPFEAVALGPLNDEAEDGSVPGDFDRGVDAVDISTPQGAKAALVNAAATCPASHPRLCPNGRCCANSHPLCCPYGFCCRRAYPYCRPNGRCYKHA